MKIHENLREVREEILSKNKVPKYTQKRLKYLRELEKTLKRKTVGERKYISAGSALTTSAVQRLVAKKTGFQIKDVKEILDSYIEVLLEEIYNRRPVEISGLGTFFSTYRTIRPTRSPTDNTQTWLSQPVAQLVFYIKRPLALKMREIILSEEEIMSNYHPADYVKESKVHITVEPTERDLKARERNREIFKS